MPKAKTPTINVDEELDEELDNTAENPNEFEENFTFAVRKEENKRNEPTVRIFLQKLDDPGDGGIKVDQYEHVTIANEVKEEIFYVLRGEWVEVPVSVYMILKQKYPKI